ncbi:phage tail protein [Enterovibrio sp. ZSDZ42]|uniref:Phage tail protein n=1 Tax=Enterovibrio gelatinilyticus TaxID=2899819 RepID=A0ABT5QWX3_9GAMM|nr:phage tail protein [Enterovibrio sp. ZSDZ42]MDD1792511.1 phage tail protein [Enterovibrio sp. ZSDZ42]
MTNMTDSKILTAAGKGLLATLNANEQPLVIDKLIFANVPNRPDLPQPSDGVPVEFIVHESAIDTRGRLSEDSVIYTSTLASHVGPFQFNWTGAYCSEFDVLVTIDHHALTPKTADQPGVAGNTMVRNLVLEYKDIAEITNITVNAESWQYNAEPRMVKMDDDSAKMNRDLNGKDWFVEDGFLVTKGATANSYKVAAGSGYISGRPVEMEFERSLNITAKPTFVYLDGWREGTPSGAQYTEFQLVVSPDELDDYTQTQGNRDVPHFVCKIAEVLADGAVVDLRPEGEMSLLPRTMSNAVAEQIAESAIYPNEPDSYLELGKMRDFVECGVNVLRIKNGSVKLYKGFHNDFSKSRRTITDVSNSDFDSIVVTTTDGSFEFVTEATLVLRKAGNPSGWGASIVKLNNAPAINAALDWCGSNSVQFVFDKLYPTTGKVTFNYNGAVVKGSGRGQWNGNSDKFIGVGIQYNGKEDAAELAANRVSLSDFRINGNYNPDDINDSSKNLLVMGDGSTIATLENLSLFETGLEGINVVGASAGESALFRRVEVSRCRHALALQRPYTLNNMKLEKVNFHRNRLDGCYVNMNVQKLSISSNSDITLNGRYGVSYHVAVDPSCVVSDTWFEDNGEADVFLNVSAGSQLLLERNRHQETKSGVEVVSGGVIARDEFFEVISENAFKFPKVNNTDSHIACYFGTNVANIMSGDMGRVFFEPNGKVSTHVWIIENPTPNLNLVGLKYLNLVDLVRLPKSSKFYKITVSQRGGVRATEGSATFSVVKNTIGNKLRGMDVIIDASRDLDTSIDFTGTINFSDPDHDNYFVVVSTTADWNGAGVFVVEVQTLDAV